MFEINNELLETKLGLSYSPEKSIIRVWSPSRESITLCLYDSYSTQSKTEFNMIKDENNVFEIILDGNMEGKFYTFLIDGMEVADPYSFASSANSKRTAIIDLSKSNPEGFIEHKIPFNDKDKAIIVETHIADISINENSGIENRGLFLGAAQTGTKYNNVSTGLDHFKELGVTHIHLLPVTDYLTVNELKPLSKYPKNYNWGYDQELYNNIEGSFSTNPNDPYSRIREFKTLIKNYHENGMSIVMDVVYNHTFRTSDSPFNVIEPMYYYRSENGNFTNGSGCGNELASERPMVRKFIVESLCYLAREYKIDGFRFDLMALTDIDTIMLAIEKLREINPNILIYGEPWMALSSPLPYDKQIVIGAQKDKKFAIFNPFIRDSIKGDNDGSVKGYIQGEYYLNKNIKNGIMGSIGLDANDASSFANPIESINYFNAHDNLIFYDKLLKSNVAQEDIKDLTYMAFSIIMTAQGIPFFHSGNSFLRTKYMDHNSYASPSNINGIDWSLKEKNYDIFLKIKNLIELRKRLGIFNYTTAEDVRNNLTFINGLKDSIIAFTIKKEDKKYLIIHNFSKNKEVLSINLDKIYKLNLIWENEFKDEFVNEFSINRYSTNVYNLIEE
ncbi:type I pullulanase [Helcococcus bovis]|uniref:type I pullulanase n=1 Tax=Helcococcus bovis TaxID=3153252 RepID=UPI0038BA5B92